MGIKFMRFFFLFLLTLSLDFVLASPSMSAQPWGAVYSNGGDVLNVTIAFGGRLPPHWQGVAVNTVTQQVVNSTDWNFSSSFNPPSVGVVKGLENLSVSVSANRVNRIEQVGSGLWLFWTSSTGGYTLSWGDLIGSAGGQCLTATEQASRGTVTLVLSNWANYCGGNTVNLDPTISQFSRSVFSLGAFNNTVTNPDSSALFQLYYNSNKSFSPSGTYFSTPIWGNRGGYAQINSISTTWYESTGFSPSDTALVDLHLENRTVLGAGEYWKDTSHNNFTIATSSPQTGVTFNQSCYLGGCANFSTTAFIQNNSNWGGVGRNWTVDFWIKHTYTDSTQNAILGYVFGRGDGSTPKELSLGICGNYAQCAGKPFALITFNGTGIDNNGVLHGSTALSAGIWYHVALSYSQDTSNLSIYLNGSLEKTGISTTSYGDAQQIRIGARSDTFLPLSGNIDEFHMWNRTLSQSEIQAIYNSEVGKQGTTSYPHVVSSVATASRTKTASFDDTGLIAWWDLGDSSDNETATNTSLDLSGSAGKLNLYNPMVNASGVIGNALQMSNSKNSYAAIPLTSQMAVMQDLTASVWVYPNDVNTYQAVLGAMVPNPGNGWNIAIANGRPVAQVLEISIPVIRNLTGPAITAGQWHLLTLRLDQANQNATFYVDGVLVNQSTVNSDATLATDLSIGAFSGQSANTQLKPYFNGLIDDVKMWNRTLSDVEIASFFNHSSTEGNWSAFTANDYSGNTTLIPAPGNLFQYRLTLNSSVNTSAWVSNVTINWANLTAGSPQWYNLAQNSTQRGQTTQFSVNCTAFFPTLLGKYLFQLDNGSGSLANQGGFILFNNSKSQIATYNTSINATWNTTIRYRFVCYDSTGLLTNTTDIASFQTSEQKAPIWSLNTTNQTNAGLPALFSIRWDSTIGLANWTFEFDNGTGVFINFSGTFTGSTNFSNVTVGLNPTQQSNIRYRWYARDAQGNSNSTPLFSFLAFQQQPQIFNQCPNGDYLTNQGGNIRFLARNSSSLITGATCSIRILDSNNTVAQDYKTMGEMGGGWYNYTLNVSNATQYQASFNCSIASVPVASGELDFNVVAACAAGPVTFLSSPMFNSGGAVNSNVNDLTLVYGLFTLVFLAAYYWLGREQKEYVEHSTEENPQVPIIDVFNRTFAAFLGVISLLFAFGSAWAGPPVATTTASFVYSNTTIMTGGQAVSVPLVTSAVATTASAQQAGQTILGVAAFTLISYLGLAFFVIYGATRVIRFISRFFQKKDYLPEVPRIGFE